MDAEFVIKLGDKAQIPILSYSSTSPCVSSGQCPYFVSVAPKDSLQVQAISALVKANNWTNVIPIYADNIEYGAGIIPYLDDALQNINARIPFHEAIISSTSTDDHILELLQKLKAKQTRVFVVHLYPELASRLFMLANELKMMGRGYVWITTTSTSDELGSLDENIIDSMQGVVGVQTYIPETNELKRFKTHWERKFQGTKLSVMGLRAYDVAWALARVVEQVSDPNSGIKTTFMTGNITDLDRLGVSPVGPRLIKALYNTRFSGLAGIFSLSDGQSPIYRIINVFGSGSRGVGFWTSEKEGLVPNLNPGNKKNSAGLRPIIWPGDATSPPRGFEIPASGNKFRVGVPGKAVFKQLVNVTLVKGTSDTPENVTGFCIDIFESVMKNLGYSGHYDYHSFQNPSYYDFVRQVYLQKYDIVVGDITIVANRSSLADFTLPFTESGVTMVVPVKDDKKSAWVFLKPLTWELWVATLCTFVFIAFAIWVLEHRINEEFRGPPLHQVGTSLFYSFSMMVFAQRENVLSNLSRCVVVVWVFVVLVLTQSYTASLTSMLTVQQLKPTVTSVDELVSSGANVGFQDGTFVEDLLIKRGFNKSKLISYDSSENLHDLLSKGEIAAVFDEIPYMRLFLALYPSKYLMMQPLYKTDGFGFAFPKGSLLAPVVSGEILNVTEGDQMGEFEKKWGMQLYNSSDPGNIATSASLSLDSFWGLFFIVGVATATSLLIYAIHFLYENRDIWMNSDDSIRRKSKRLVEVFENRDMAAHTFRKRDAQSTPQNVETYQTSIIDGDGDDDGDGDGDGADGIALTASTSPSRLSNSSDKTQENLLCSAGMSPSP
ncbi:glutamate receptor 2.8-like [Silene latifolia]|uniref:glutamate receptor 2.8-like n=1 Tax=Silene latifolia TaxID=37657 RepID=UPI003D786F52